MREKKPDEKLRDRINARARKAIIEAGKNIGKLTEFQKRSPSERKSLAAKAKEKRRS